MKMEITLEEVNKVLDQTYFQLTGEVDKCYERAAKRGRLTLGLTVKTNEHTNLQVVPQYVKYRFKITSQQQTEKTKQTNKNYQ